MEIEKNTIKTKFHAYISFNTTEFDTIPDVDDDKGCIDIPTVCLDGDFTLNEIKKILKEFKRRINKDKEENKCQK